MGRGYSFDVIRARMLFDPKARKDGSVVVAEPAKGEGGTWMKFTPGKSMSRQRNVQRVVEYAPFLPTLVKLLDAGHFE